MQYDGLLSSTCYLFLSLQQSNPGPSWETACLPLFAGSERENVKQKGLRYSRQSTFSTTFPNSGSLKVHQVKIKALSSLLWSSCIQLHLQGLTLYPQCKEICKCSRFVN